MFEVFATSDAWIALVTLTAMEIVLGIDNIVFISIVAGRLPPHQRALGRNLGLLFALLFRVILLLCITWIVGLTEPVIELTMLDFSLSGRDLIMLAGGIFLLVKSTLEIHHKFEDEHAQNKARGSAKFWTVVSQIVLVDIVFSFDSVVTAVGLVQEIVIMVIAVVLSLGVMLAFAGSISAFIEKHPTVKMLALSFLLMIGTMLIADGLHFHIPKGYIYFAMAFSLFVEVLNIKLRQRLHT